METNAASSPSCRTGQIEIRPLAADDRDRLAGEFSHLSEQSRRRRFGGFSERLNVRELDRLTRLDHHCHEAVAAVVRSTNQIVGVARYIALPGDPRMAEVAVEVVDEWQGLGIGRRLIAELTARARAEGIGRLLAYVSRDNLPVHRWLARVGAVAETDDGEATVYGVALATVEPASKAA